MACKVSSRVGGRKAPMAKRAAVQYDKGAMSSEPGKAERSAENSTAAEKSEPIEVLWWRAFRLRCPSCGRAPIFSGWFTMHDHCAGCGRRFNRDAGYLLGSIYFNYGVTASIVVVLYFAMFFGDVLTNGQQLAVLSAFGVLFPMWFFRYARALWMSFDERWDPWPNEEEVRRMRSEELGASGEARIG
jgi:uncharacterized protein (DUF983 family)